MAQYIVADVSGKIVNRVEWDGVSRWAPPSGYTAHLDIVGAKIGVDLWDHAKQELILDNDPKYLEHLAKEEELRIEVEAAEIIKAEDALLAAKLLEGKATQEEIQQVLARFLIEKTAE